MCSQEEKMNKLKSHGFIQATGVSFGVIAFMAFKDYNREMTGSIPVYQQRNVTHLGPALFQLHRKSLQRKFTYHLLTVNAERCDEMSFLLALVDKKAQEIKTDPVLSNMDEKEVNQMAMEEYRRYMKQLIRRALIRNGLMSEWIICLVEDELVEWLAFPSWRSLE